MSPPASKLQSSSYRSQKATVASLSLLEKLDTIPVLLTIFGNIFAALFTGVLRKKERKPKSFYRYVMLTAMRTMLRRASVRQQHYLTPPTDDGYLVACKKRGVQPHSEVLEDGTKAHWIGEENAEKLIINFHGGGYGFPASPTMFEFMFQIISLLKSRGKNVSCLFLSYDLAPGQTYPRQLQQASSLLLHVLQNLKISPSNILLTGDSAGANLALSLLSHISHPHPSTTVPIPKIKLGSPLRGVVLISPWVSFNLSDDSFTRNKYKDCICTSAGKQWSSAFLNSPWPHTSESDYYNEALTAPESWWEGLQVQEMLIVAGEEEVLIDGIRKFDEKFRRGVGEREEGGERVQLRVVDGEYHDQPSVDLEFGYKESEEGQQAKIIKEWIASKL